MTDVDLERRPTFWVRAGSWLVRAVRLELGIYASIGRALARRPAVPQGAAGFGYHRPILTILVIFIVLSAAHARAAHRERDQHPDRAGAAHAGRAARPSPKGGEQHVEAVRVWTDEPKAFLREVATHL
jgi:hypothetical protein